MLLLDVFDKNYIRIENISKYSFAQYNKELNGAGSFEIHMQFDSTAKTVFKYGKFILLDLNTVGIITFLNPDINIETGKSELVIKGFLSNWLLSTRCIPYVLQYSNSRTNIARTMVDSNFVNPTDPNRAAEIVLSTNPLYIPETSTIEYQVTGGSVEAAIEDLLSVEELGYDLYPILTNTSIEGFEFRVIKGTDRSVGNLENNSPVVISSDLKNILQSSYTLNNSDCKNMAYVAGEGTGTARTVVETGSTELTGFDRYELYVDARDLQKTDSSGRTLSTAEYLNSLSSRGNSKLEEYPSQEVYAVTINPLNEQFEYGVDYFIGDQVTVQDLNIDKTLTARVTGIQVTSLGERFIIDVTFGYYKLSTAAKLQRNGVI